MILKYHFSFLLLNSNRINFISNSFVYLKSLSTSFYQMDAIDLETLSNLAFEWMKFDGPHLQCCSIIHPESKCAKQILNKMLKTMSISKKFYAFFHVLPFLIRLKKNIRQGKTSKQFFKTLTNYIKSILFMVHLTGGLKLLKCSAVKILNPLNAKIDGKIFLWGSFLSSLGIFWQDNIRRQQITYFAFVRSLRSSYMYLKRRNIVQFKNQKQLCFILIFGFMSYIFSSFPQTVKFTNILSHIWGTF